MLTFDHIVGAISAGLVFAGTVVVARLQERTAKRASRTADWEALTERMESWTDREVTSERERAARAEARAEVLTADRESWITRYRSAVRHIRVLRVELLRRVPADQVPPIPADIERDV